MLSLAAGGIAGFGQALQTIIALIVGGALAVAGAFIVYHLFRYWWNRPPSAPGATQNFGWSSLNQSSLPPPLPGASVIPVSDVELIRMGWAPASVEKALGEIDWYQFEKFCAALLISGGYVVERKGGAQPDGGVDLIATKDEQRTLVQCKHWRTWKVQEKTVREMLGSMAHFGVPRGVIYTLKGWTSPAASFAAQHNITLVDGPSLARRASSQIDQNTLDDVLQSRDHHCPKCEAHMIFREGNFTPFWGCSTYPRCRGTLKYSGAR